MCLKKYQDLQDLEGGYLDLRVDLLNLEGDHQDWLDLPDYLDLRVGSFHLLVDLLDFMLHFVNRLIFDIRINRLREYEDISMRS